MKVLSQGNFPVRMKATGLKSVLMKIYTHSILMHVTSIYGVEVNIMSCNVLFSI